MENFAPTLAAKLIAAGLVPADSLHKLETLVSTTMPALCQPRQRKMPAPPAPHEQCVARVWGKLADGTDRCSLRRKCGSEFCARHRKQAAVTEKPCQVDENGKHMGLFNGRIDRELPWLGDDGTIRIEWKSAEHKLVVAKALAAGTAHRHPNARRRSRKKTKASKKPQPSMEEHVEEATPALPETNALLALSTLAEQEGSAEDFQEDCAPLLVYNSSVLW